MYVYTAGSPGTFSGFGAMSWANATAPARVAEIQKAISLVKEKAPAALPLLYGALSHAQQAIASPEGAALLRQAEVGYRGAAITAERAGVFLPELKNLEPPAPKEEPTKASVPLKVTEGPPVPAMPAAGQDLVERGKVMLLTQYGPLQGWQWIAGAGAAVVAISLAQKIIKFAVIGGALAGGALIVGKASGVKLS